MSTATADSRLYAVPPPSQQERLGLFLRMRRAARRALDAVLALPRAAAGWVLRHARTILSALADNPTLARLGARLRGLGALIRAAGPWTVTASVLSIPVVWRAATRAARWVGSKLTAGATAAWRWTRTSLGRFGPTGVRICETLDEAGSAVGRFITRVIAQPITQALVRTVKSVARLVRPVSQSLVVHRLAATFVAAPRLRVLLELVRLPFVLAPGLTVQLGRHLRPVPAEVRSERTGSPVGTEAPSSSVAESVPRAADQRDELLTPRNRAERRAQQQAQAHAKRAVAPR